MSLTFCFHAKEVSEVYLFHSHKKTISCTSKKKRRKMAAQKVFFITKCFSIRQLFIRTFVNTGV